MMYRSSKTSIWRLLSALVFTLGCMGFAATVFWLELPGFAPGLVVFGVCWLGSMTLEARAERIETHRRQ